MRVQLFTNSNLTVSAFGSLYQDKNNRISAYLDVVRALEGEFECISITLKPRNDILYVDALAYMAATLEDDSLRRYLLTILKALAFPRLRATWGNTFHSTGIFFAHCDKQTFNEHLVIPRKRRELDTWTDESSEQAKVLDLSDIHPSLPNSQLDEIEALELVAEPSVHVDQVESNLSGIIGRNHTWTFYSMRSSRGHQVTG